MKITKIILVLSLFILIFAPITRAETQRLKKDKTATPPGILRKVILKEKTVLLYAKLESISGPTLTVSKDGKTYTVNTDTKTRLKRKFFGNAVLSEMQQGDILNVHGFWTDENKTAVNAVFIRDISIQKRFGAFVGTIKSKLTTGFILSTIARGEQTVIVNTKTRYVNRLGRTIDSSEFAVGQRVRVRGLWNNTNNTITEVTNVKNFDLPAKKPTTTPTP